MPAGTPRMRPLQTLIRPFVAICLFRIGPQDLPASPVLLGIALAAHALSGMVATGFTLDPLPALGAGLMGTTLLSVLTATLLAVVGLRSRTVQTLTALAGADAIITFLTAPVLLYAHGSAGRPTPLAGVLILGSIVWSISVYGHVLRNTLATHMAVGVAIAVVFTMIGLGLFNQFFVPG